MPGMLVTLIPFFLILKGPGPRLPADLGPAFRDITESRSNDR